MELSDFSLCLEIEFIPYTKTLRGAAILPDFIYDKFSCRCDSNEAVIIYSSGTTGKSKGIILSHFAIQKNADAIYSYLQPKSTDVFSIVKSMPHSSTLVGELLVSLKNRIPVVIFSERNFPGYVIKKCNDFFVTAVFLNPKLLALYAQEVARKKENALKYVHSIYVSGSILDEYGLSVAKKSFPDIDIYNVYGLTEAGPRVTAQTKDAHTGNSVGRPIEGVSVKIVDDDGEKLGAGERGTVFVKTPSCFSGYVSSTGKSVPVNDGWINTGDYGYMNENSELFIVGRNDTCILYQSHKVYPEEIENVLMKSGYFSECLVTLSESELVCCYSTENMKKLCSDDEKKILTYCKNILPPYEFPSRFFFVEQLKRNNNGKIIRGVEKA